MNCRVLVASIAVLLLLPACATMKTNERSRKITVLAAREAANIADADTRLTLQLNIANGALVRFQAEDGMAIISEVVRTLRSERERLRGRTRLSGWVSASQLSRLARNPVAAAEATRAAAQELDGLASQVERCQYLLGVAEEVRLSQGEGAAVDLLSKGGVWANAIDNREERRQARLAFASALLEMNALDNAVLVLRHEKDAGWSSAMLLALAETTAFETGDSFRSAGTRAEAPVLASTVSEESLSVSDSAKGPPEAQSSPKRARPSYGKAVDFSSVFQNRATPAAE